jgi:putative endonuclease
VNHYVYILYSDINDRYYIGSAADINNRLSRHNAGATLSTKSGRPWKIVFTKMFDSKTAALKFEIYLKRMKSRKLVESLIASYDPMD